MFNLNNSHLRVVTRIFYSETFRETKTNLRYNFNLPFVGHHELIQLDNFYTYDVDVLKCENTENCPNSTYTLQGGYTASIMGELSRYLNFSFEILPDPSLTYRFDLTSKLSIDLFAASYSLQRSSAATVVVPTFVTGQSKIQMFLNRHFESTMSDAVLLPFDTTVWVLLVLLIIFVTICAACCTSVTEGFDADDGAFQILANSFLKGGGVNFQSVPCRIVALTISVATVVIYAAYSGSIVSINAVKKYSLDSFDKVLSSHFDIGFDVGFNNGSVIQSATDAVGNGTPSVQKLYNKMIKSTFKFNTFQESFVRVSKKPFSYVIDEETGYATMLSAFGYVPCEIASISFRQIWYPWGMFMARGSKYRPAINYGLQKLRESGQLRYFMRHWLPGIGESCSSRNVEDTTVKIGQLNSAFFINFAGFLLAFLVFGLEKIQKWREDKNKAMVIAVVTVNSFDVHISHKLQKPTGL